MFQELLFKQQALLAHYFENLNLESCEKLLNEIVKCSGVLFFTGIGKSGFIAQKISATLMSTGTKAFYLPPIDALHGDLGMISANDYIFLLSKSGETDELLHLLPFLRNKGSRMIAITSHAKSRLAQACDFFVELPCKDELCPFGLAPTVSTEIQLLFGDALAIALMRYKKITVDSFAQNHPAGLIGRRATLKVRDFMLTKEKAPLCLPDQTLEEVLPDFTDKRCGCLVVVDEARKLKGIFTDGDLRRALQAKGERVLGAKIGDLMTKTPRAIGENALAWEAIQLMEADQKHPIM
ncbi:MAG TPA: KpsF/GutQ family sugar-phosphate isomerase, partial [Myxococcota bacterium]|nr:KpsF/GutQ family sugar-phosphate isomerase [Myxococcota bacterium]